MSSYQYPDTLPVTTGGRARPGWWDILADADKEGRFGPADPGELYDDYCQLAIYDQSAAPTAGFPRTLLDANVHGFSLEFGASEMADIDLVGKWDRERILPAGPIDIKTHYCETPEDIIERVRTCLEYRDPERLEISTDCGLRRVPRDLAISKMSAAAEAARRLRSSG